MNKKIFNFFSASLLISLVFYSCSKKDVIDDPTLPCVSNMTPATGSTVNITSITLGWTAVNGATAYDVYIGSSPTAINLAASDVAGTSYNYTLPSAANATYYWYVQPKGNNKEATDCASSPASFNYVSPITPPPSMGFMVIEYFPSYRSVAEYPDRMFKMCNVVNYAFAAINPSSTIDAPSATPFNALYTKAKANGAKVFLSVNATDANFFLLRDAARRNTLVKSIMTHTRNLNLDGIDMDYEYPRTTNGTDTVFALLMKELSDSLHMNGKYYLSAAITPGRYAGAVRDGLKNEVFAYADFFNVMVYDDFNTTVPYKHHSNMDLVNYCTNYWINTRGMPKEKFVLGIPAYGRNSGAAQISTSFKAILATGTQLGPSPVHLSDSARITPATGPAFTTYYSGHESVKQKALSAKSNGGGFMFWEMGHDANDDNALLKVACDAIGKTY